LTTVLVIGPDGSNLGNHPMETAERIAEERFGLDLVEVRPGVYKILDMGKLNYEASKRKQVKNKPLKEMKFKLNIGDHDFNTKIGHVNKFLSSGNSVKITIWFTGREVSRPEAGIALMFKIDEAVSNFGTSLMDPALNGKNMHMVIEPRRK
jgi:translation initiation factor IF-3